MAAFGFFLVLFAHEGVAEVEGLALNLGIVDLFVEGERVKERDKAIRVSHHKGKEARLASLKLHCNVLGEHILRKG